MVYTREITDPVTIQFIILFTLYNADAPLAQSDMLNIILGNCNISFIDFQLAMHNLVITRHVHKEMETELIEIFEITDKGRNLSDLFHSQVPVYIREPLLDALKEFYKEKRRRDAVRAEVKAVSLHDYSAECSLYDYDKTCLLKLSFFAGSKEDARSMVESFKANYIEIYTELFRLLSDPPPKEDDTPPEDLFLQFRHTGHSVSEIMKETSKSNDGDGNSDDSAESTEDSENTDDSVGTAEKPKDKHSDGNDGESENTSGGV